MNTGSTRPEHASRPTSLPRASQANGEEARDRGGGPTTTILSVSHMVEDHIDLRRLFERARWETREAHCCREAIAAIAEQDLDVVLCEARLPDGDWKDLLDDLSRRANPPYLIVTSRLADESLWAEVLNLGGYDVLAKPFVSGEVCRVVGLACEHHQERQVRSAAGGNATTTRGPASEHRTVRSAGNATASRPAC
jgi:two-component system response regulator HydG